MDPPSEVEDQYFTAEEKRWLVNHWNEQTRKGNGFAPPQLTSGSTKVPTIKLRYFSGQGDGVVVKHPTRPNCWRWLTIPEVKKLHSIPASYDLGESKIRAGEILGQGVIVSFFHRIITAAKNLSTATQHSQQLTRTLDTIRDPHDCLPHQPALAFL